MPTLSVHFMHYEKKNLKKNVHFKTSLSLALNTCQVVVKPLQWIYLFEKSQSLEY